MKTIKKMKSTLKMIEERVGQIPAETDQLRERLESAKNALRGMQPQIAELRNERQDLLVEAANLDDINKRIEDARKSEELLADEIEGLTRKLTSLESEKQRLADESQDLQKEIFEEEILRPLIVEYNDLASRMADVLKKYVPEIRKYTKLCSLSPRTAFSSSGAYMGPRSLPGMWVPGESPVSEHYNRIAEHEKATAHESEISLKERYPDCKCFRCQNYSFAGASLTVGCSQLRSPVPYEMLAGQTISQNNPAYALFVRCNFVPAD